MAETYGWTLEQIDRLTLTEYFVMRYRADDKGTPLDQVQRELDHWHSLSPLEKLRDYERHRC